MKEWKSEFAPRDEDWHAGRCIARRIRLWKNYRAVHGFEATQKLARERSRQWAHRKLARYCVVAVRTHGGKYGVGWHGISSSTGEVLSYTLGCRSQEEVVTRVRNWKG